MHHTERVDIISKYNVYVADFETNNYNDTSASVWAWDLCNIYTLEHWTGSALESFFNFLPKIKYKSSIIYFHNLKFDGTFILLFLLKSNFKYANVKSSKLQEGEFTCLIDNMKRFYSISFNLKSKIFELRDSLKKIPLSVSAIAKAWNLPILKGEIDYKTIRPEGHILTNDEVDYIRHDTEIVARALFDYYAQGMKSITLSADCMHVYKQILGVDKFNSYFPVLPEKVDTYIRNALLGGICYAKETNVILHNIKCYDVNSMYPSVMYNFPLPYGRPRYVKGNPVLKSNEIAIMHIKIACAVKPNHFNCLMYSAHNLFAKNVFIESTEGEEIDIYITSFELEEIKKHYDTSIKYIDCYIFKTSSNLFTDYVEKFYNEKKNATGGVRQLAKFKLNMLFGRFGLNPRRIQQIPYIGENGELKFIKGVETIEDSVYTAISVCITSYARCQKLIPAVQQNWENFVYCDTDSIFLKAGAKGIEVDKSKLGAWDLEKTFKDIKIIGPKTYTGYLDSGEKYTRICGAPDMIKKQIDLGNFEEGREFYGKLQHKNVEGGVVLTETTFTLKSR